MLKIDITRVATLGAEKNPPRMKNWINNTLDIAGTIDCSPFVNLPNGKRAFLITNNRSPNHYSSTFRKLGYQTILLVLFTEFARNPNCPTNLANIESTLILKYHICPLIHPPIAPCLCPLDSLYFRFWTQKWLNSSNSTIVTFALKHTTQTSCRCRNTCQLGYFSVWEATVTSTSSSSFDKRAFNFRRDGRLSTTTKVGIFFGNMSGMNNPMKCTQWNIELIMQLIIGPSAIDSKTSDCATCSRRNNCV